MWCFVCAASFLGNGGKDGTVGNKPATAAIVSTPSTQVVGRHPISPPNQVAKREPTTKAIVETTETMPTALPVLPGHMRAAIRPTNAQHTQSVSTAVIRPTASIE